MGENYTQLVDSRVSLADAPGEGARMLRWLQTRGIVGEGQREGDLYREFISDDESSLTKIDTTVYRPGPHYRKASMYDDPERLHHNWLTIYTEHSVYHAGEFGVGIYCTACGDEQSQHGEAWSDAIQTWWEGQPETLVCEKCGYEAPLSGWRFDPVWGFGNLCFSFHNWHLYPHFIEEFEKELGRPLTVVIVYP